MKCLIHVGNYADGMSAEVDQYVGLVVVQWCTGFNTIVEADPVPSFTRTIINNADYSGS
jgi:hypothetical protein